MEDILKLIGAVGLGTLLSGFLSFLSNSKNNLVEFEVESYQTRRAEIISISNELATYDLKKVEQAIEKLRMILSPENSGLLNKSKEQIDKIGKVYYLKDGHIWQLISTFNYSLESNKLLRKYLRLLLEYEDARVRKKVNWNITLFFALLCKVIPILLAMYLAITIDKSQEAGLCYLIGIIFVVVSELVIPIFNLYDNPNDKVIKFSFYLFYVIPLVLLVSRLIILYWDFFSSSFGMKIAAALIILILGGYSYVITVSRIDSEAQAYINKIKCLKGEN